MRTCIAGDVTLCSPSWSWTGLYKLLVLALILGLVLRLCTTSLKHYTIGLARRIIRKSC